MHHLSSAEGVSEKHICFQARKNRWSRANGSIEKADESSAREEAMAVGRSEDVPQVVSYIDYISYCL
jgi:hypothetical protein